MMDELERDAVAPGSGLGPLELPSREAAHVETVSVQAKHNTVAVKFDLEFQLVPLHLIAAYRACHAATLPAESAVGPSDGQPATADRLAGLLAENRLSPASH